MTAPRLRPGTRRQVGLLAWALARSAGRLTGTEPPAVFLILARHRRLFWGWLHFAGRLMPGGRLPRRETELVILRTAHLCGSDYEFAHHVRLGRRAGVTEADVSRVIAGPEATGWSARERLLMRVTDELFDTEDLAEATWAALSAELDPPSCLELLMLIGHYRMLATTLGVLRVRPDRGR